MMHISYFVLNLKAKEVILKQFFDYMKNFEEEFRCFSQYCTNLEYNCTIMEQPNHSKL
jgi:hypothetical protein